MLSQQHNSLTTVRFLNSLTLFEDVLLTNPYLATYRLDFTLLYLHQNNIEQTPHVGVPIKPAYHQLDNTVVLAAPLGPLIGKTSIFIDIQNITAINS